MNYSIKIAIFFLFVFVTGVNFAENQIEGIDHIYLINLDRRPCRLKEVSKELERYSLFPEKFSAIDGRKISFETLCKLGLPYNLNMKKNHWARTPLADGTLGYAFLGPSITNKPVFSEWMTIGAIGCALSHLSILKDAYDAGYSTILVLEDDIQIKEDPHILSKLIRLLDSLTDKKWDLLYTDPEFSSTLPTSPDDFWWMWRPDLNLFKDKNFIEQKLISKDFIKVGSRDRTHSMILRRSGIKKILDHIEKNHLYLPIDHEIAFASDMLLYTTTYPIITYKDGDSSDVQEQNPSPTLRETTDWELYKQSHLGYLDNVPGWCGIEKSHHLMNFIYRYQPNVCVEIGTFGGSTTFPMILALQYLNKGHIFTIDSWDNNEAVTGLNINDPNYSWWKKVNLDIVQEKFFSELERLDMQQWCTILNVSSSVAFSQFDKESIDLLYIDGNFSEAGILQDIVLYYPKVKKSGYIWINDANLKAKRASISFLNEHAIFLEKESIKNQCVVFQKK